MGTRAYVNGYEQYGFADFAGGLNLRDKADTVGDREAIDLLNVNFNERGAIMQRDGFADLTVSSLTNRVDSLSPFYKADGTRQLIAGCGVRLEALNATGGVVASQSGLFGGPYNFVRFGAPGSEYLYAVNGADLPQRWDGAAWTVPTATVDGAAGRAMPRAGALAITAGLPGFTAASNAANRLVATAFGTAPLAGPNGAPTTPSTVYLSNPGAPEVWETDGSLSPIRGRNRLELLPGDGEAIMNAVSWRELTFIFKESKFFVLWGEDIDPSTSTPVFHVREVVNDIGLAAKLAITVGRDGVYFFDRRGVYRTSGGDPILLSDKISPLWTGNPAEFYRGKPINPAALAAVRMCWHDEQLFVAVPTGTSTVCDRLLVYDTQHDWWTVYDIAASALAPFRRASRDELHHGYASGLNRIGHREFGSTDDRGAEISSRWRSGWSDYQTSQVKTIRETHAWGIGEAVASFSVDYNIGQSADVVMPFTPLGASWIYSVLTGSGGSYAQLGGTYSSYAVLAANAATSPAIGERMARVATRGVVFSTQFANSPGQPFWSIHRVARNLREIREASIA